MAEIEVLKTGTIFEGHDNGFGYCGWPTLSVDKKGVLYAAYSGNRMRHICPFGKIVMHKSFDGGETWTDREILADTVLDDRDPSILTFGENSMLLNWLVNDFDFQRGIILKGLETKEALSASDRMIVGLMDYVDGKVDDETRKGGSYIKRSDDGGLTWSAPSKLPVYAPHGPNRLPDGSFIYFGRVYSRNMISAYRSTDGLNWEWMSDVPLPKKEMYDKAFEPYCIALPSGRLLGVIRIETKFSDKDPEGTFTMYTTYSDDMGKTWSAAEPTGLNGSPPHMIIHSSGALILSYGRRQRSYGEKVALSYDEGKTWEEHTLFDDAPSPDLGYTTTAELPDGTLVSVYYQRKGELIPASCMYTKWRIK